MFGKGSKLYSIFAMKCPRCHVGNQFDTGSYSFKAPFDMRKHCANCALDYDPEPGFYYGSMFISYILTGFFSIGLIALLHWYWKWDLVTSFGVLLLILGVNYVWIFRISRSIWINFFVGYRE